MPELPLLPAMGVGSYAAPGWFIAARRLMREDKWGAHDIEELLDDATRIVVADQLEAGVDVITDGELSRLRPPPMSRSAEVTLGVAPPVT